MPRFRLKPWRPTLRENDVERACRDLAALRGYKEHRLHCGRARFPDGSWVTLEAEGMPDWLFAHGQFPCVYLETKRPGGCPSPGQKQKLNELRIGYRLAIIVADSVESFAEQLKEHERKFAR